MHEVLGVGTLTKKPRKGKRKDGTPYLMQYRWRCTFRDAYYVCCLIWPWAHTKLPKITQVMEHYNEHKIMGGKVINLDEYKKGNEFRMILKFYMWIMGWSGRLMRGHGVNMLKY